LALSSPLFTTYNFLRAAALLVGLAIAIPLVWRSALWVFFPPMRIAYAQAVAGRITAVSMNRQYYLQQLDGHTYRYYDFNAFVPALSTVDRDSLSQDAENDLVLGTHLVVGDYVRKAANSAVLTVQHGEHTSTWRCPTAD
jgi:hypothetical protein